MTKRVYWNTKTFKDKVVSLTKGEYELKGEYTKTHAKTTFKHIKCGTLFDMTPHNFLAGQRCPNCSNKKRGKRKSYEQFRSEVKSSTNDEYDVLPPYKNNKTKVEFIHLKCNHHFVMKPNSFLSGQRCPKCAKGHRVKLRTMTNSEFLNRVKQRWGDEYTVLSTYKNSDTPVKVKHNRCGNVYMTRPADFLRGHGCLKCSYADRSSKIGINQRTPLSKVKESIKNILGINYVVLTKDNEYKGNRQHIKIKHLVCGTVYDVRYSDIQSHHTGCPYCALRKKSSYGERLIRSLLINSFCYSDGSDFIYGYIIPDLKYKNNLHFDFWLPNKRVAIEYDGEQHYKPISFWGGIESYKILLHRDQLKNTYCINNNITLIRIPYTITTKKQIYAILSNYLCGHK